MLPAVAQPASRAPASRINAPLRKLISLRAPSKTFASAASLGSLASAAAGSVKEALAHANVDSVYSLPEGVTPEEYKRSVHERERKCVAFAVRVHVNGAVLAPKRVVHKAATSKVLHRSSKPSLKFSQRVRPVLRGCRCIAMRIWMLNGTAWSLSAGQSGTECWHCCMLSCRQCCHQLCTERLHSSSVRCPHSSSRCPHNRFSRCGLKRRGSRHEDTTHLVSAWLHGYPLLARIMRHTGLPRSASTLYAVINTGMPRCVRSQWPLSTWATPTRSGLPSYQQCCRSNAMKLEQTRRCRHGPHVSTWATCQQQLTCLTSARTEPMRPQQRYA